MREYKSPKYKATKTIILAEKRIEANITQREAAHFFGYADRGTIAAWEQGKSSPRQTVRAKFIQYLARKLRLREQLEEFYRVWVEVMEKEWGWDELTPRELDAYLPNEDFPQHKHPTTLIPMNEALSVGGIVTDMIVLAWASYRHGRIRCSYDQNEVPLPSDIVRLKEEFVRDCEDRKARGDTNLPYNSLTYKLKAFDVGYRDISNREEIPVLNLSFGPTDYFTHRVTDLNIHNPVRDKYMRRARDITIEPVPEFATTLGVNLNLLTKEGYLIITERSLKTETEPSTLHTSVGEGLLRPLDAGHDGAPDPFRCAIRGTLEELGVLLKYEDVEFNAFCVHVERGQYSLFGWSKINETQADVELLRSLALPKDKWENRSLLFVPCNPNSIAQFMAGTWNRWSATGIASAIFSLMQQGYTVKEINEAFLRARPTYVSDPQP